MSVGLQLISSIIGNGSRDILRGLRTHHFTEDEQPAWRFVSHFFDTHGAIPSFEICHENGIMLPRAEGPISYFRDQLRNRSIYSVYVGQQQRLMELFGSGDMPAFVAALDAMVQDMRGMTNSRDSYSLVEALDLVMEDFEAARAASGFQGIPYGWPTLDDITGGARRGDLHTLVARPGVGKSYSLARMALSAWSQGFSVGFVSMEMHVVEIARRFLAMGSGVSNNLIQRGHVSAWGEEQLRASVAAARDRPPFNLLIGDLSKSVRDVDAMLQEHEPDVMYVDASYLLRPSKDLHTSKRFELASETMRELRSLATARSKPIIQTVQFNRAQKADEEMSLDNIGGTDEVGQLSALVLGMRKGAAPFEETRRVYRIVKNRHGRDNISFDTEYHHEPFNMDEIAPEGAGVDENGDWDGTASPPPARDEWTNV